MDPFEDIIDAFSDGKKARNGGSEGKAECMPTAYRNHSRHQWCYAPPTNLAPNSEDEIRAVSSFSLPSQPQQRPDAAP